MVRLRVHELLEERGWTAYRLAQEAGFTISRAYRLAREDGQFASLPAETLDSLCEAFNVEPGELLERVKGSRRKKRTR